MIINTKYFGEREVTDAERINFPEPLPGFEDLLSYIILPFYEDDSLLCLQSVDDPDLAFVMVNPIYIMDNYTPIVAAEDLTALQANEDTPLAYYALAVVHDDWKDSTVNLKCPIAVNPKKMLGKQLIMEDTSYSMRHPVYFGEQKEDA